MPSPSSPCTDAGHTPWPGGCYWPLVVCILAVALGLRWPALNDRPMHTDEAVNAIKVQDAIEQGHFVYDPREHHGPVLYLAGISALRLGGHSDIRSADAATFRRVSVLAGMGLCLLPLVLRRVLGEITVLSAMLFLAVAPAQVYYHRYFIHEPWLVLFTWAALLCAWRWWTTARLPWALALGLCLALMHATKETAVLAWVTMGPALLLAWWWNRRQHPMRTHAAAAQEVIPTGQPPAPIHRQRWRGVALALATYLAMVGLLFTWGLRYLPGWSDAFTTFSHYLARAADETHRHPWHWYGHLLAWWPPVAGPRWTELALLFPALAGAVLALVRPLGRAPAAHLLQRSIALNVICLGLVYSLIPYKTPWNLLTVHAGLTLLAGVAVAHLWQWGRHPLCRVALVIALLLAAGHLAIQAQRANAPRWNADRRNPWVYAHPGRDVERLAARLQTLVPWAPALPRQQTQPLQVIVLAAPDNTWPLPWYLRQIPHVGYWTSPAVMPEYVTANLVVTDDMDWTPPGPATHWLVEHYGLRPGVVLRLFIDAGLWQQHQARTSSPHSSEPSLP